MQFHLEYSNTVWDPHRIYQQPKREMVQRPAARVVCNHRAAIATVRRPPLTIEAFCSKVFPFAQRRHWRFLPDLSNCILPVCSQSDSRDRQDLRSQAESGGFITLCITMSSIPCSRSIVISVPLSRQRRHLERIQCV